MQKQQQHLTHIRTKYTRKTMKNTWKSSSSDYGIIIKT